MLVVVVASCCWLLVVVGRKWQNVGGRLSVVVVGCVEVDLCWSWWLLIIASGGSLSVVARKKGCWCCMPHYTMYAPRPIDTVSYSLFVSMAGVPPNSGFGRKSWGSHY